MTSIEYGGGPTLEQRKRFCNLKDGGHIPGYMGYVPQFHYRNGSTFGNVTHEISKSLPYYNGPSSQTELKFNPVIGSNKLASVRSVFKDEVPGRRVPKSTGDNKYTERMIPGYSGDIPHLNFKFGGTYRSLCDESIDEIVNEYEKQSKKRAELREIAGLFPRLRSVAGDPRIRDHMNLWTDELVKKTAKIDVRRSKTEAPIPGYMGFVPRLNSTEVGLGNRYHVGSERGLKQFRNEITDHFKRLQQPMNDINSRHTGNQTSSLDTSNISRRIFHQEGMVPSYTGHVHGHKYATGNNFGNTTRELEVCQHYFPSYGEYLQDKLST